jgi:hypothetical protein
MYSSLSRTTVICAANDDNSRKEARQEFRKNIMDRRRASVGKMGNKVSKFVRSEVSETRSIFDEHVKFFRNRKPKKQKAEKVDVEVIDAEFFE